MYIAYSAQRGPQKNHDTTSQSSRLRPRLKAYRAACNKYRTEIIAIQKYLPGWMPPFKAEG